MATAVPTELGSIDQASATTHVFTVGGSGAPAGTLLVVRGAYENSGTWAVTDSKGNMYTNDVSAFETQINQTPFLSTSLLTTSLTATDTITITLGSTGVLGAVFAYFTSTTGFLASPFDAGQITIQVALSTWTSFANTNTHANDLILILVCSNTSGITSTPGDTFIEEQDTSFTNNTPCKIVTEYEVVSAIGTYSATGTWSTGTAKNATIIASYKLAPDTTPLSDILSLTRFPLGKI